MMLFATRKPRRFRYVPRYGHRQGFDFHAGLNKRKSQRTLVLIVLLVLLLALMIIL